jgi:hypothetical protein
MSVKFDSILTRYFTSCPHSSRKIVCEEQFGPSNGISGNKEKMRKRSEKI